MKEARHEEFKRNLRLHQGSFMCKRFCVMFRTSSEVLAESVGEEAEALQLLFVAFLSRAGFPQKLVGRLVGKSQEWAYCRLHRTIRPYDLWPASVTRVYIEWLDDRKKTTLPNRRGQVIALAKKIRSSEPTPRERRKRGE